MLTSWRQHEHNGKGYQMILWIVTNEPYHDNSTIVGVHTSEHDALAQIKQWQETTKEELRKAGSWDIEDYCLQRWDTDTQCATTYRDEEPYEPYRIFPHPSASSEPV